MEYMPFHICVLFCYIKKVLACAGSKNIVIFFAPSFCHLVHKHTLEERIMLIVGPSQLKTHLITFFIKWGQALWSSPANINSKGLCPITRQGSSARSADRQPDSWHSTEIYNPFRFWETPFPGSSGVGNCFLPEADCSLFLPTCSSRRRKGQRESEV